MKHLLYLLHVPSDGFSFQNIICAQCFHWFANEKSLKEMTRVLVPGGRICKYIYSKTAKIRTPIISNAH